MKKQPLTQPLRARRDYGEEEKDAAMIRVIPMDNDDDPEIGPKPMILGDPSEDYDAPCICPRCGRPLRPGRRHMRLSHCMDPQFDKIRAMLKKSELGPNDRKAVEKALKAIHKKYLELERKVEK